MSEPMTPAQAQTIMAEHVEMHVCMGIRWYGMSETQCLPHRLAAAYVAASERIERLVLISNVNGDWNLKFMHVVEQRDHAIEDATDLREAWEKEKARVEMLEDERNAEQSARACWERTAEDARAERDQARAELAAFKEHKS